MRFHCHIRTTPGGAKLHRGHTQGDCTYGLRHLPGRPGRRTVEHAMDTDVLIDIWPMHPTAITNQAVVPARVGRRLGETPGPRERHRDAAAVRQLSRDGVLRDFDVKYGWLSHSAAPRLQGSMVCCWRSTGGCASTRAAGSHGCSPAQWAPSRTYTRCGRAQRGHAGARGNRSYRKRTGTVQGSRERLAKTCLPTGVFQA